MSELVKTSASGYFKNKKTGVVINRNLSELYQYRLDRDRILKNKELESRITDLEGIIKTLMEVVSDGRCNS